MKTQTMISSVIVGVDFSKYSRVVVRQGAEIARSLKLPLVYVHAFDVPLVGLDDLSGSFHAVIEELKVHLERKVQTFYNISTASTVVVKCGSAFEQIVGVAKSYRYPLIVVGHRGSRGAVSRFFLGSTAERLALHSLCPVWIHRSQSPSLPKRVLVPCDLTERSNRAISGIKCLGWNELVLEHFHVRPVVSPTLDHQSWKKMNAQFQKSNAQQLKKFRQKYHVRKIVESEGDVIQQIKKKSAGFDLVAISPRKHEGMLASFGSVTSQIVRSGQTSVLVIP